MPEIARELMEPAKAIKEIRVLQTGGFGGSGTADGARPALGAMSPILRSILEAGAAYPMMRELLSFAKVDQDKLGDKAQAALGQLTGELGTILKKEEERNGAPAPSVGPKNGEIEVKRREAGRPGG